MSTAAVSPIPAHALAQATGAPPAHEVREVFEGLYGIVVTTPWLGAALLIGTASWCVRAARAVVDGGHDRDPVRRFSRGDKAVILARAGHRCEAHHPLYGRCERTENLQADHVHPHSRGGWTAVPNGQALCARHNKAKSARAPWIWELQRLARRRATYFPAGTPTEVIHHRPRPNTSSPRSATTSKV